ncbi:Muniscin C-terminal mu homology domain-domain-containing protein [Yarrowia lipolytica]|uniref:Muniscin C-terminal mu homology domain-domain-containing protein n=1 Tax=Yarrowia lipolytica TaxID=4952 RepID=A0A371CFU1_YARLL|nr:Muniscin C-terminal mu homology domain-domain-containing protein [Yarrowia lipolytica]RDW35047.1 Muniscin C-terminal mu homology domain-domain-containing protein [Yarrowia lipolytica]RDW42619.1 Muniscin C-terminal mu homology domain-domain-containing protein [Yarrowia lipolytica]RDW47317.1 Muniscin C-terminal mu homology domain-domain-containing protein [Yarrowia lipolytica]RDW53486.1 Muniscin C-terminal mu homology domain-domain-containing protein [Yarrowia lipolytica]
MSRYSTVLDQSSPDQAVQLLQSRITEGESTLSDLASFVHDRTNIEKRYIEDLQRVAQRHAAKIGALDDGDVGVNSAVNSLDGLWRKIAVRDINETIGAAETYVRRVKSEVEKPLKNFPTSQQGNWADVKVLSHGLNEVSRSQSEWQKQAPYVFKQFESADTGRVVFVKDALTQYLTLSTDKSQQFTPVAERLLNDVLSLEPEDDINVFVSEALKRGPTGGNAGTNASVGAGTAGAAAGFGASSAANNRQSTYGGAADTRSANYAPSTTSTTNPRNAFRRNSTRDSESIYSTNSARNSTHDVPTTPQKRGDKLRSKVGSIFGRKKKDDKKHVSTLGTIRDQPGQSQRAREADREARRLAEIEEQKAIERQIQEDREEEREAAERRAERAREQAERTNKQQPPLPPASRSPDMRTQNAQLDTSALSSQLQFPAAGGQQGPPQFQGQGQQNQQNMQGGQFQGQQGQSQFQGQGQFQGQTHNGSPFQTTQVQQNSPPVSPGSSPFSHTQSPQQGQFQSPQQTQQYSPQQQFHTPQQQFQSQQQSQQPFLQPGQEAPFDNADKPLPPPSRRLSDPDPHGPPKVDIRQDVIAEEGDANEALNSVASTLRNTSRSGRGRRDIQSKLFTDVQPADIESQAPGLPPIDTNNLNGNGHGGHHGGALAGGALGSTFTGNSEDFHSPIGQSPAPLSHQSSGLQSPAGYGSMPPPNAPFAQQQQQPLGPDSTGGDAGSIRSLQSTPNVIKHPELLISEALETYPLRASIVEQINANITETHSDVSVNGEVAIAYVPPSSAHTTDYLQVRLLDPSPFAKFGANPSAVINPPSSPSENSLYNVNAHAIKGRTSLGFKYSLTPDAAAQSLPVVITPIWRFEPTQARLMLSIKLSPSFPGEAATLTGGVFSVSVDGANTLGAQSKPVGSFSPERRRITWRLGDTQPFIIRKDAEQRLLCQFKTDGLVHPAATGVEARFTLTSSLTEGVFEWSDGGDWQPVGHLKSFLSGKFNSH